MSQVEFEHVIQDYSRFKSVNILNRVDYQRETRRSVVGAGSDTCCGNLSETLSLSF